MTTIKPKRKFFSLARSKPEPAVTPVVTDELGVNQSYRDMGEYHRRTVERQKVEMERMDGFFKRIDEVFEASGIKAVLHNNIPDKMLFGPDPEMRLNAFLITVGWKPSSGVTVIAKIRSSGFLIPDLLPDNFISPNYPIKFHTFKHTLELAVADKNSDAAFRRNHDIPVLGKFDPLPSWFVDALKPLVPKA